MRAKTIDSSLIDALGGTGRVAALCGITPGAVSQWRTNGVPKAWREFLRLARPEATKAWETRQIGLEDQRPP
ncbi:MAG TPA: hypothetical protein DCR74_17130 [Achromobacter sp.]|nr:hypothetical protein [Achromobacter sp.]